jgi:hypothetical protein
LAHGLVFLGHQDGKQWNQARIHVTRASVLIVEDTHYSSPGRLDWTIMKITSGHVMMEMREQTKSTRYTCGAACTAAAKVADTCWTYYVSSFSSRATPAPTPIDRERGAQASLSLFRTGTAVPGLQPPYVPRVRKATICPAVLQFACVEPDVVELPRFPARPFIAIQPPLQRSDVCKQLGTSAQDSRLSRITTAGHPKMGHILLVLSTLAWLPAASAGSSTRHGPTTS